MLFKKVISKEGWELRLHEQHEIFSISIFKDLNYDEPIDVSYIDLYMLAFNYNQYSLLTKSEISSHLELLDKICYVHKQKELLDYAISNYQEDMKEWKSFINPSVIEIFPKCLLKFPEYIDDSLEAFSKLYNCDELKREKLLEYAQNDNIESFTILFNKSLVNEEFLLGLFKYGIEFVEININKGFNNWNWGMYIAAIKGEKDLIDFFIDKGADNWNWGMHGAARGGHKDLVELFINKGASDRVGGMRMAAEGGHKELVDFFIEKGVDDWEIGMCSAAKGGHKELVDFFIEKGGTTWNGGMVSAAEGGHKDLVLFFIEKGANDWDGAICVAAYGGHKELVELFIEKGATNLNRAMDYATNGHHKELVDFLNKKLKNL